ncbi:MAG: cation:proton antiporter [Actinobacteria bacterium]|nr:cation:proton antiporter [Actinomycetota bacterium]
MQTMTSFLPASIVLVSFIGSVFVFFTKKNENLREAWTFITAAINIVLLFKMAKWVLAGNTFTYHIAEVLPGLPLFFKVDGFGMLFAFVAGSLWVVTSLYSIGYMRPLKEHAQTRYFACFALAISATMGVAFSGNVLTMYLFYEILSLSTYPLVTHHQDAEARGGGRKYLTFLLTTSIGFALPAMIITYLNTGTLTFSNAGIFTQAIDPTLLIVLLLLFIFGFAKSGMMPFHVWLPGAMVVPTPVSALLHAVAVVKVGVFCVLRILTGVFGIDLLSSTPLSTIVCVIASITVIVSSLIALTQDNLKRRLAFSTVGQLSYIVLGAGIATSFGVVGSMTHIAMHAFGKITLFFCAGAIFVATGKKYISQMVGIGKQMPVTMIAFLIGSMSVIGLPLTGGIISKWYMVLGAMDSGRLWILIIYLISSLLNAAYFFPIVYNAFFCKEEDSQFPNKIKEAPLAALLPPVITAIGTVILFIYPELFLNFAKIAVGVSK